MRAKTHNVCRVLCTYAVLSLTLYGSIGTSNAALVDAGNSVLDTATNLKWLDLTETQGLSVNAALAANAGYTLATRDQVAELFTNAGFVTGVSDTDPLNDPAANQLLSVLGCTQFCGTVNATGRGFADNSAYTSLSTRPFYGNTGLGSIYALLSLQSNDLDFSDVNSGVYLVTQVPIPAAIWLFGSALGGLGWLRRKKIA